MTSPALAAGARRRAGEPARSVQASRTPDRRSSDPPVTIAATSARAQPIMRLAHRVVLAWGWRRAADRVRAPARSRRWRWRRLDLWPVLFLTFPVLVWLVDGAAAGRLGGAAERVRGRLVVRLRLFLRRALLDRPRLPGRRQDVRLAAAVRGRRRCRPGWRCSPALGLALARAIWTRGPVRILALAIALTVAEWLRGHLFTGFPWNTYGYALTGPLALAQSAALIGIWGLTFLAVAVFATPGAARRRPRRHAPALAAARARRRRCSAALAGYGAMRLARTPTQLRRRRAAADHAAQPAAGREVQLRRQAGGDEPLPRAVRPLDRAAVDRRARRHASDLAGIGVSVLPDARGRGAGADRRAAAAGHGADHRRGARARAGARRADVARLQLDLRDRPRRLGAVGLRQGASGAVRRIPAVPGFPRAARPDAAHQGAGRLHPRRPAPRASKCRARRASCR